MRNVKEFERESLENIEKAIRLIKENHYIESKSAKKFDFKTFFRRFYKKYEEKLNKIGIDIALNCSKSNNYWGEEIDSYHFTISNAENDLIVIASLQGGSYAEREYNLKVREHRHFVEDDSKIDYELRISVYRLLLAILEKIFPIMLEKNSLLQSQAAIVVSELRNEEDVVKQDTAVEKIINETSLEAFYVKGDERIYAYVDKELCEYEKCVLQSLEALLEYEEFNDIAIVETDGFIRGSLRKKFSFTLNRLQSEVKVVFNYQQKCYVWCSVVDETLEGTIDIKDMLTLDAIKESFSDIYEELALADIVGITKDFHPLFRGLVGMSKYSSPVVNKRLEKMFQLIQGIIQVDEAVLMKEMRMSEKAVFKKDENLLNGNFNMKYFDENGKMVVLEIIYRVMRANILGVDIGIFEERTLNLDGSSNIQYTLRKLEDFDVAFTKDKIEKYRNMIR